MATKKKAKPTMSPEARAAASERMKKLNEAKRAEKSAVPPAATTQDELDAAHVVPEPEPVEPLIVCDHEWLAGQYRGHEHGGLQLTDVYCPKCGTWKPVKQ